MSDMMTPSEQRVWDAAFGAAYVDSFGWSDDDSRINYAVRQADESVLALREYRTKHGPHVGAVVLEEKTES